MNGLHDVDRLAALAAFDVLDTPAERGFDDVVHLASHVCATPVALVSLVAGDRQWFKARKGFDPCQTSLDKSVCVHALGRDDLLIIPDLAEDVRTRGIPLVTGPPHLRFYAGAPLRTPQGATLGTLCVIDHVPRPEGLTSEQATALEALARQVMDLMELRRAMAERDRASELQREVLWQQEVLIDTQRTVATTGDLDAILDAVVGGAMRAIPRADGGVVQVREGDEAYFRAARGSLGEHVGLRFPLAGSLAGSCILSKAPILCPDVRLDVRAREEFAEVIRLCSAILVPVVTNGEVIGALKLQSGEPDAFSYRDLQVARLFAGTVSSAFAHAAEAEARRTVRDSAARYRAVFESAVDYAIVVTNLHGIVTEWNEGAARVLGWTEAEMLGQSAEAFFTPEDRVGGVVAEEMRCALELGLGTGERWHVRKDGTRFWGSGEMTALRDGGGKAVGFVKILRDRTEQRDAQARVAADEARLRTILDTVPVGVLFAEAPSWRIVGRNGRMDEIVGVAGGPEHGEWVAFHGDGKRVCASDIPLARVIAEEAERASLQAQCQRRDGTRVWLEMVAMAVRDADGILTGAVMAVSDIDARKGAEAAQALTNGELSHRMKNLMTMVLSIANQTMRGAVDATVAREVLSDRLIALSKAHDVLLGGTVQMTTVEPVIRGGVGVLGDDAAFSLSGPVVAIGSQASVGLAMTVHELTTNAAKYGSLSVDGGKVEIEWRVTSGAEPRFLLEWREVGGPAVVAPTTKGYGTQVIERGFTGRVGGRIRTEYDPAGVRCRLDVPLSGLTKDA